MHERRYSRYTRDGTLATLYHLRDQVDAYVLDNSVRGNSVLIVRSGKQYRAVVLARSSDWYYYSLNCVDTWHHDIRAIACGTHDSCIDIPVFALDTMRWYAAKEARIPDFTPQTLDEKGRPDDTFARKWQKGHYGHNIFIGALMCGREDALQRLSILAPSTRYRIEAEVRRLHMRRDGKPLAV